MSVSNQQRLFLVLCLLGQGIPVVGQDGPDELAAPDNIPDGRHRLDLGVSLRDATEGDILTVLPAYSLAFSREFRMLVATSLSYLEARSDQPANGLDEPTSSGLGDSLVQAQYSPAGHITASPWIPDNIGLSASLLIPTGDPEKGLGSDNWEWEVGLGWSFNATRSLWLVPATYYLRSLDEGGLGVPVEELGVSLELRWLFDSGIWFGYRPTLVRDLLSYEWADDHSLVLGKMFSNGFGLALEYGRADRLDKIAQRDDYVAVLNLYYQFGQKP